MKEYRSYSFWLETCDDDLTPRPALPGPVSVDVAILGAGYSGLWTAYYLLQRDPSLKVALLEREIAGYGASGRNGGWCSSGFSVSPPVLQERFGRDRTIALQNAMYETVDEVGNVCEAEGIDAQYLKGGALNIARGRHEVPLIEQEYESFAELGLADRYRLLSGEETATRLRVTDALGALFIQEAAVIHPGRLVRGLARAVERKGGTVYEQTEVTGFQTGSSPSLQTQQGEVRANAVVLAGEAYLSGMNPFKRQIAPIYSLIVLTEPLSDTQWSQIGWQGRETVSSNKYTVDYLQRTADGRILFGSRGEPYHLRSRIEDSYDRHEPTHAMIKRLVLEWFPMLGGAAFTHSWGGPVGMPRDFMPTVSFDKPKGFATARGYTGMGVATSNLAGRTLADLITGTESALTELPMVGHHSRNWEPEPFRWLGVRYMQTAYARIDEKAARTGRAPTGKTLAERLSRH